MCRLKIKPLAKQKIFLLRHGRGWVHYKVREMFLLMGRSIKDLVQIIVHPNSIAKKTELLQMPNPWFILTSSPTAISSKAQSAVS